MAMLYQQSHFQAMLWSAGRVVGVSPTCAQIGGMVPESWDSQRLSTPDGLMLYVQENGDDDGEGVVTSQQNYGQLAWRVVGVPCQHLVPISGKSLLTSVIIIRAHQMVC